MQTWSLCNIARVVEREWRNSDCSPAPPESRPQPDLLLAPFFPRLGQAHVLAPLGRGGFERSPSPRLDHVDVVRGRVGPLVLERVGPLPVGAVEVVVRSFRHFEEIQEFDQRGEARRHARAHDAQGKLQPGEQHVFAAVPGEVLRIHEHPERRQAEDTNHRDAAMRKEYGQRRALQLGTGHERL